MCLPKSSEFTKERVSDYDSKLAFITAEEIEYLQDYISKNDLHDEGF